MTAVFRDNLSAFTLDNVENVQWEGSNGKWLVMFDDYEVQEIDGQLVEIQNQGSTNNKQQYIIITESKLLKCMAGMLAQERKRRYNNGNNK